MLTAVLLWGFALLLPLAWRYVAVLRSVPAPKRRQSDTPLRVCVVLGSGGHTSEMMRVVSALKMDVWKDHRPFYVVSSTDSHSAEQAVEFERRNFGRYCWLHVIPRARGVGESYFVSIFKTLYALWWSIFLVFREKPDLILVNGPGVCVPVVVAALLMAMFSPSWYYCRPAVVFIETYSSVSHMSVSGSLLGPLSDVCVVQWSKLYEKYRSMWWWKNANLKYLGTKQSSENYAKRPTVSEQEPTSVEKADGSGLMALVTVGSTQFTSLIEAMDDEEVLKTLAKRGFTRLLVQKGTTPYVNKVHAAHGVSVEVFTYRPNLHKVIQEAALVISHAGAGTTLEVLECKKPMIAVPNRTLMLDHQLEFAEALSTEGYIYCVQVSDIRRELQTLDLGALRVFPGTDITELRRLLLPVFSI
uniref:UDP-N-acetylglucosamine transferase subunit ALG14 n=1 Tax=Trypanosoma congolense (strain IL3000) TaxID=1068625 RepID=G0UNG0_TRYCI|nr:unnamed protein product [Trypanosoma congolense IL3000]